MSNTRGLTQGALAATLAVILVLASAVPGLSLVAQYFLPVPAALIAFRYGLRTGILSALAAASLVALLVSPFYALAVLLVATLPGVVLGEAERRSLSPTLSWVAMAGATATGFGLLLVGLRAALGSDPLAESVVLWQEAISAALRTYEASGVPSDRLEQLRVLAEQVPAILKLVTPAVVLLAAGLMAFLYRAATRWVGRRLGFELQPFPPFGSWNLSPAVGALYMLALVALVLLRGDPLNPASAHPLVMNVFLVTSYGLAVQGLAAAQGILTARGLDARTAGVILAGLSLALSASSMGLQIVGWFGLWDMVIDLRKTWSVATYGR